MFKDNRNVRVELFPYSSRRNELEMEREFDTVPPNADAPLQKKLSRVSLNKITKKELPRGRRIRYIKKELNL